MAENGSMDVVSGLAAILFFGGWNGPLPVTEWLGLSENGWMASLLGSGLAEQMGNLLGACNFILKCFLGVTMMMWLRWTLPRLRIDQVMTTCLKYCVPLASAMFLGAMLCSYFLPGGMIRSRPMGQVSEAPPNVSAEVTQPEGGDGP